MKEFFSSKKNVALSIVAFAVVLTLIFGAGDPFTRGVKLLFSPVLSAASYIVENVASIKGYFVETDVYKAQNEQLIRENVELSMREKSAAQYRKENERLLKLLDLKEELSEYDTVAARVVSYDPDGMYSNIMINKGTASGIDKDDIVLSGDGVCGKVVDAGLNWAQVSTILSEDNAIGTRVIRTGEIAVTEGDAALADSGRCRLSFVNQAAQISVGDFLETTGSAGVYPEGLAIGKVSELSVDNGGARFAVVEPMVKFSELYEVLVIKR